MFDEKLFFKLCEKYNIEVRKGKGKPMLKLEDGTERELTKKDIKEIFEIKNKENCSMKKYEIYKDEENIDIFGNNECFTKEDIKSLWEDHNILYLEDGIIAIWIEERENASPLIHIMDEDDGHIFWHKKTDRRFDSLWLDNYIQTLTEVKNLINCKEKIK